MPHPNGEISVSYAQIKGKWKAEITLPKNIEGTFIWKGKTYELKSGEKTSLTLWTLEDLIIF
jgi:hypothetical protein